MIKAAVMVLLIGFCAACSQSTPPAKTPAANTATNAGPAEVPKSTVQQIVEDMTGKTTVDAGQRAKATIRRVNAQKNAQYEEIQNSQ